MMFSKETYEQRVRRLMDWHRWFAWHPVSVADGKYAWLRFVQRRATPLSFEDHGGEVYEYRLEAAKA